MDRGQLIAMVAKMVKEHKSAEDIVDAVIAALMPEDGEECPVCGIAP